VTASYCTPDLEKYSKEIEEAGITALMEVGLDPGIDHMIAKDIFDDMSESGLNIVSYKSYTGGLPAPEFSQNPLRYKFSWSPESALMTTLNSAKYIENGKVKEIKAGGDLMLASKKMSILPGFNLHGYPNRDSTAYIKKYGLNNVHTLIRGTLRYKGFADAMWSLIQMGLLSTVPDPYLHVNGPKITWKQFLCKQMEMNIDVFTGTLKNAVFEKLNEDKFKFSCLEDFDLFKDIEIEKKGTPIATFSHYLSQKLIYEKNERDVVIMVHEVVVKWPENKLQKLDIRLVVYGDPNGFMAMAKTVGYPAAIGVKMLLDGEIQKKGIVLPMSVDIYRPMLKRLKKEGIEIIETSTIIDNY